MQQLFEHLDRHSDRDYMLLARTPRGVGELPLRLPRAQTGEIAEAKLVLSIARTATGEPQLFLGAKSVALDGSPPRYATASTTACSSMSISRRRLVRSRRPSRPRTASSRSS